MPSNSNNSEVRMKKATEAMWKFWWFAWYLIIAPFIIGIVSFFLMLNIISFYFTSDPYILLTYPLAFSVLVFMFSLLFFFKAYDKYRKNPFFLNKENNLVARINILFLITLLSLGITPIFIFISPEKYTFELLPLISFIILYNIVWYYYYFEPIDFFNLTDQEFNHFGKIKLIVLRLHNFIIIINYVVQIIFLSITSYTKLSWLFAIITNFAFYPITILWTKNQRNKTFEKIKQGQAVLMELRKFQQKFVVAVLTMIFCFLGQIPIILLIFNTNERIYPALEIVLALGMVAIFMIIYFKIIIYIHFYYDSHLIKVLDESELENYKNISLQSNAKYQKVNAFFSILLISTTILIALLLNSSSWVIFILPIFYVLVYFEHKTKYFEKKSIKFVHIYNTCVILAEICFGIIPLIGPFITWNIQLIIFFISLYFILEIYVKLQYFDKNNVILVQNLLAIASFFFIVFSLSPIIVAEYILFTTRPFIIEISRILINFVIFLILLLFSFYRLFIKIFDKRNTKGFRICILLNLFTIELFLFFLICFRVYFIVEFDVFIKVLIFSTILFPTIFLGFLFVNYLIGIFSNRAFLMYSYYSTGVLIATIFVSIEFIFFPNYIFMILGLLIFSVLLNFQLKFGLKLKKIKEPIYKKLVFVNSYLTTIELFFIIFLSFYLIFDMFLSIFISLCSICVIVGFLSKKEVFFSNSVRIILIEGTLLYGSFLIFLYSFICTFYSFYVFFTPVIAICISLNIPIYYLRKEEVVTTKTQSLFRFYSLWILISSIFLLILFTIINFIDILFNYALLHILNLIFLTISAFYLIRFGTVLQKFSEKVFAKITQISHFATTIEIFSLLFILFKYGCLFDYLLSVYLSTVIICLLINALSTQKLFFSKEFRVHVNITTLFFTSCLIGIYFFIFIYGSFYLFIVPWIFTSISLYFLLFYMLKKEKWTKIVNKALLINSFVLAICITLIPTIIAVTLTYFGNFVDLMTVLNSTLYILFLILLFVIIISKIIHLKENKYKIIVKTLILIAFGLSITTAFYYPLILLYKSYPIYSILVAFILCTCALYIPSFYSYKKKYFNELIVKRMIIGNSIALSLLIISIPGCVRLELLSKGIVVDLSLTIILTIFLVFGFLKFLENISKKIQLKEENIIYLKIVQIFTWFSISVLILRAFFLIIRLNIFDSLSTLIISTGFFIFFSFNIYNLIQFKYLNLLNVKLEHKKFDYDKLSKLFIYSKTIVFYGICFSLSFIFMAMFQIANLLSFSLYNLKFLNIIWYFSIFFSYILILLSVSKYIIRLKFKKLNERIKLCSWTYITISICLFLTLASPYSVFNKICLFILVFSLLFPISFYYLKKADVLKSEKNQYLVIGLIFSLFLCSILCLYIEVFWSYAIEVPYFYNRPLILLIVLGCNMFLLTNFWLLKFKYILKKDATSSRLTFSYLLASLLFASLLYFNPVISLLMFFISYPLILYNRNRNYCFLIICYFFLSYITFVEIIVILDAYSYVYIFEFVSIGFLFCVYLITIAVVLIASIILNMNRRYNAIENFSLYTTISILSFVFLITYTEILYFYDLTISLFIFLLFTSIYLARKEEERYKLFVRPCILLAIFDSASWISYSILFTNPNFDHVNPILTFTFTLSLTGYGFILLYNNASEHFRTQSFFYVLILTIGAVPTFIYFLLITYFPITIEQSIALIISINIGIFLFYLSIGLYQWKLSWSIWKTGWWMWNLLPIVNFYIIYRVIAGVDIYKNALKILGNFDAFIFSIVICSIFELPALYTWIKEHFDWILCIIWSESLYIVYWVSQNVFIKNVVLINLSFFLFAVMLFMPLLYKLKYWSILSNLWILLMIINIWFLIYLLWTIGLTSIGILASMGIIMAGLFLLVYSFFPNIRFKAFSVLFAYFVLLSGIFLIIFFVVYSIVLHPIISINIASIVIAATLFSSKYIKLDKNKIHFAISLILISNFSLLTFFSFSLIPQLELFALFLAIAVGGGSLFIFNHYEMFRPKIDARIPWIVMGAGTSSSISYLLLVFLNASPFFVTAIWLAVNLIFLYFIIEKYGSLMWYLIPVPIALLIVNALWIIESIRWLWLFCLLMFYFIVFQLIINIFNYTLKRVDIHIKEGYTIFFESQTQIKILNLTLFLINSSYIALFVTLISPYLLFYQILEFLIVWSILVLFCLRYPEKSGLNLQFKKIPDYLNKLGLIFYLILSIMVSVYISFLFLSLGTNLFYVFLIFIIFAGGIVFFEVTFLDTYVFKDLYFHEKNTFAFWSWAIFCNSFVTYIVFFVASIQILNIRSLFFILLLLLSVLNILSVYFYTNLFAGKNIIFSTSKSKLLLLSLGIFFVLVASLISDVFSFIFIELIGTPSFILFFLNSSLFLFALTKILNKKAKALFYIRFECLLFIAFQGFFGTFWIIGFGILKMLNIVSIWALLLIETLFSRYISRSLALILKKLDKVKVKEKIWFLFYGLFYVELAILLFGAFYLFLGIIESLLLSQICLFALSMVDIVYNKKIKRGFACLINLTIYIIVSVSLFLMLWQYIAINVDLWSLYILLLIVMQFYTVLIFSFALADLYPEKIEHFKKWKSYAFSSLGILSYSFIGISVLIAMVFLQIPIEVQLIVISILAHLLMICDQYVLNLLKKHVTYPKVLSWILLMTVSLYYIIPASKLYPSLIPLIVLFTIFEALYLVKMLEGWQNITIYKDKIFRILGFLLYLDFIAWPWSIFIEQLKYFPWPWNIYWGLFLLLCSSLILLHLTYIDNIIKIFNKNTRIFQRKLAILIIGTVLSIDIYTILALIGRMNIAFNLSVSLLTFTMFTSIIVRPFKEHSLKALIYWVLIFGLLSVIIYYISLSSIFLAVFITFAVLIYPFVFFLDELRVFFNKLLDKILKMLKAMKIALELFFRRIKEVIQRIWTNIKLFFKKNYKPIWIIFSAFLSFSAWMFLIKYLMWHHALFICLAVFGLLYSVLPSEKSDDPDAMFKRRMIRLLIIWGSVILLIINLIPVDWILLSIFMGVLILGAVSLPYIYYKEKKEHISIKYRFYTLISLIIIIVIFSILLYIQFFVFTPLQ